MPFNGYSPITEDDAVFTGEDSVLVFTIRDDAKALEDLTGWTLQFLMAATEDGTAVVTKSAVLDDDPETGVCTVSLAAADTTSLDAGVYHYTLRRTNTGSNQVVAYGPFVLQKGPSAA